MPPAPDEELDDDADDADDEDEVDEGPPEDELTPMPPVAPVSPPPGPPPPAPPEFVPPDPFVVPDGSLRGPLAEQATMTNDDRTEAVRSRLACFTRRGSAESSEVSSLCGRLVSRRSACFTGEDERHEIRDRSRDGRACRGVREGRTQRRRQLRSS